MSVAEEHQPDPHDTERLRKLLDPIMRECEKWTLLGANPAREAFLDTLIKRGIVPLLPELNAWAERYLVATSTTGNADGTTPHAQSTPPAESVGEPSAYPRPQDLAILGDAEFLAEVHALAERQPAELERLTRIPGPGDVDVFSPAQRQVIGEVQAGTAHAETFEIMGTGDNRPGQIIEHNGRLVRVLGLTDDPGMLRVAHVDPSVRYDEPDDTIVARSADTIGDEPDDTFIARYDPPEPITCTQPGCNSREFAKQQYLDSHNRLKHPHLATAG